MAHKFSAPELLIASSNPGKIREIKELLQKTTIAIRSSNEFSITPPDETGKTFKENALLKAIYYCNLTGLPALADDSGLSIDALNGAPGIYSARWAHDGKDFSSAMSKIEALLTAQQTKKQNPQEAYSAHFTSSLALAWPNGEQEVFEGIIRGTLTFPPRGNQGFGYDPIFIPEGKTQTFAEMPPEEKHRISHRARAFEQLMAACFT